MMLRFNRVYLSLPDSRFQITLGFGEPLAKHGMANEFPEITSISFGGFFSHDGGTTITLIHD